MVIAFLVMPHIAATQIAATHITRGQITKCEIVGPQREGRSGGEPPVILQTMRPMVRTICLGVPALRLSQTRETWLDRMPRGSDPVP